MANDVDIYKHVSPGGMKIQKAMALHYDVQQELSMKAIKIVAKGNALLAEHHKTGEHKVYFTTGNVDRWIVLEGTYPGAVEFGHKAYTQVRPDGRRIHVGASDGLFIISRASGLRTVKGTIRKAGIPGWLK